MFLRVSFSFNGFPQSEHLIVGVFLMEGSCSRRLRSTSCWFIMLMPSSMTKSIATLPANTAWLCNRKRCSAKHQKFVLQLVELLLTYRHRCVWQFPVIKNKLKSIIAFWSPVVVFFYYSLFKIWYRNLWLDLTQNWTLGLLMLNISPEFLTFSVVIKGCLSETFNNYIR